MGADEQVQADTVGALLRESTSRLLTDLLAHGLRAERTDGAFPAHAWAAIEELGLPVVMLSEAAGGFGIPTADALSLLRVAGEHALPLPLAETMLARWLLAQAGIEAPSGPLTTASGFDITWDAAGRVSGWASDVPWGRHAQSVVLLASAAQGPVVLCLPQGALTVETDTNIAGDPRDTIRFDAAQAAVAASPIGVEELQAAGATTRVLMMAGALGAVSTMTAQHAQERKQFGRAIGKFQAVQQNLAVLAGQAASAGAASDIAAEAVATWGPWLIPAVAAAKARAGEAAGIGAAIAHQVHGAIGLTQEHRLHEYTRRLWAWRDEYGREAEWSLRLGRHLSTTGPELLWSAITAI